MTGEGAESPGLRELRPAIGYDTAEEALHGFYVPALSRAVSYDRSVGYFRASALSAAARGLSRFIAGGGCARFLVGAEVAGHERDALVGATEIPPELAERLAGSLVPPDEIDRRRLEVLAWLVREGRLELRVAVAVDDAGRPVPPGQEVPYFHEKIGVLVDGRGDGVAFQGSVNETRTGWAGNFESFSVYRSWDGTARYYDHWVNRFERRWEGDVPGFRVFPMPDAVERQLLAYAPEEPPDARDPEEGPQRAGRGAIARFLLAAPHLVDSAALAEATSAVTLFPHQRKVVERLAGEYPRSWLVADEVGLGKTISAGAALRRLLLSGDVERVLVLAPANVCRQWQDELFERFGLWVPRLEGNELHGAHPDDVRPVPSSTNPYDTEPVLLVSSHLARRSEHQGRILTAARYDLLIVDEAHHARRRGADVGEYRPSRLLQLLDDVVRADHASAIWLLTATPLQLDAIELIDLLRIVGLDTRRWGHRDFIRFYSQLAETDDAKVDWAFLSSMIGTPSGRTLDEADNAVLARARTRAGILAEEMLRRFGSREQDPQRLVGELNPAGRAELRMWIRHRGPVGQLVTRHTRATLKRYRDEGRLDEPLADRDVQAVTVGFTRDELDLYDRLDDLLDRLMQAHGTKRGAGFVLNVYRRRLTSSWTAIERTLRRRLDREGLALEPDFLDEADADVDSDGADDDLADVDQTQAVPLTATDRQEIEKYLGDLARVPDSKFDQLRDDINDARGSGQVVLVFTQFTDTLDSLCDRLHQIYRSHLATFTGAGGREWREDEGWVQVSKQELVEAIRSGRIGILLATDAASEGLNLQNASYLVNYDVPYNPSRVEQRIGRADRLGQLSPVVTVRNYFIPGTVEEAVYRTLADRIDLFAGVVGQLQPILGATEAAFKQIFRAPRSERAVAQDAAIEGLRMKAGELETSGLDLGDEDPLPLPQHPAPPVTLERLNRALIEELDVTLDTPGRPTSSDPERVSRDPEEWTALATYGHPRLEAALRRRTSDDPADRALVITELGNKAVVYRSDRTPPERVNTLDEIVDLSAPVAAGDAEAAARSDLERAVTQARERARAISAGNREKWERDIRDRFRRIVARAVRAEQLLRLHRDGEAPEANLVWLDLINDHLLGWASAESFRQYLEIPPEDLLPRGGPGADDRTDRVLARVRRETNDELVDLIVEWRDVALP